MVAALIYWDLIVRVGSWVKQSVSCVLFVLGCRAPLQRRHLQIVVEFLKPRRCRRDPCKCFRIAAAAVCERRVRSKPVRTIDLESKRNVECMESGRQRMVCGVEMYVDLNDVAEVELKISWNTHAWEKSACGRKTHLECLRK